jgi:CRP-like cAMP-binding protein
MLGLCMSPPLMHVKRVGRVDANNCPRRNCYEGRYTAARGLGIADDCEDPMSEERYEALRGSRLATELDDSQCRTLAGLTELRDLKDGEVLVREGSSDDHLFVVISGALGVVRHPQGEPPVTLHTLVAGDFAGELSFIDDTERYASLQAVGPTRVLSLRRPQLESLLQSHPEIVYRAMRAIVRTAHAIQRRLSIQSVELANYIYKQHGRY